MGPLSGFTDSRRNHRDKPSEKEAFLAVDLEDQLESDHPGTQKTTANPMRQRSKWWQLCIGLLAILALFRFIELPGFAKCKTSKRIPLEAHIMSKCPDAKDCLHDLVLPAMIQISDKVDFTLSYIGNTTDSDDGVACKHGPTECLGNMIELCAAKLYPDPKTYLGFTMCLTREYSRIPERALIEDCALEHGIEVSQINKCVADEDLEGDGPQGHDLLKASFERSDKAGVTKSCTVRLEKKIRCIRDDGEWKDCEGGSSVEDLVADIKKLANRGK